MDTLLNVERLRFADTSVALDMGPSQPGGEAALLIGAVLGHASLFAKKALVGAVIDLFDRGYSLSELSGAVMRLPIWGALANGGAANASDSQIATYLLTIVNGKAPDAAAVSIAVNSLVHDSQGEFLLHLAQSAANLAQIDLVGLTSTGLEFSL